MLRGLFGLPGFQPDVHELIGEEGTVFVVEGCFEFDSAGLFVDLVVGCGQDAGGDFGFFVAGPGFDYGGIAGVEALADLGEQVLRDGEDDR